MDVMRDFHRSTIGKLVEFASAATAAGAIGYGGMEYARGQQAHAEAWKQFSHGDHRTEQISHETLDRVPADQREQVFASRDAQYDTRLAEAIQAYHAEHGADPDSQVVAQLQAFHPSERDRALLELGLGRLVETNVPLPAIRLAAPRFDDVAPSVVPVGAQVRGRVKPSWSVERPDTIFIKPEEDHVLEVMQHEYAHLPQLRRHGDEENWRGEFKDLTLMNPFQEGMAELTRLEVNKHLGFETQVSRYGGERMAAFTIQETIGRETLWQLYRDGDYAGIEKAFDQKTSPGLFRTLLDGTKGGIAIFELGPLSGATPEHVQSLSAVGALSPERFEAFTERYGVFQPSAEDMLITTEDGKVAGFVTADSYRMMAGLAIESRVKFITNDADVDSTDAFAQVDAYPTIAEAWDDFKFAEAMNQRDRFDRIKQAVAEVVAAERGKEKK